MGRWLWRGFLSYLPLGQMFVHDATPITPLPLLFFGGDIQWGQDEDQEVVIVDNFIVFRCPVRNDRGPAHVVLSPLFFSSLRSRPRPRW